MPWCYNGINPEGLARMGRKTHPRQSSSPEDKKTGGGVKWHKPPPLLKIFKKWDYPTK
jgi:hypothetical protein